jgi:hypothetical protein
MKLLLLLTLATGIVAMTFSQTYTSSNAGSSPAIQNRIEASPQFKKGGFNPYENPLDIRNNKEKPENRFLP